MREFTSRFTEHGATHIDIHNQMTNEHGQALEDFFKLEMGSDKWYWVTLLSFDKNYRAKLGTERDRHGNPIQIQKHLDIQFVHGNSETLVGTCN